MFIQPKFETFNPSTNYLRNHEAEQEFLKMTDWYYPGSITVRWFGPYVYISRKSDDISYIEYELFAIQQESGGLFVGNGFHNTSPFVISRDICFNTSHTNGIYGLTDVSPYRERTQNRMCTIDEIRAEIIHSCIKLFLDTYFDITDSDFKPEIESGKWPRDAPISPSDIIAENIADALYVYFQDHTIIQNPNPGDTILSNLLLPHRMRGQTFFSHMKKWGPYLRKYWQFILRKIDQYVIPVREYEDVLVEYCVFFAHYAVSEKCDYNRALGFMIDNYGWSIPRDEVVQRCLDFKGPVPDFGNKYRTPSCYYLKTYKRIASHLYKVNDPVIVKWIHENKVVTETQHQPYPRPCSPTR
jgi:hypothetical protein